jgi:8-oxo-dGTP pyrophosphatase MutT (NUDIX family)
MRLIFDILHLIRKLYWRIFSIKVVFTSGQVPSKRSSKANLLAQQAAQYSPLILQLRSDEMKTSFHFALSLVVIKTFGVRILVLNDSKILLVKHRYGNNWVMPGGKIEKKSTPEKTAFKELYEETGLIINKIDFKLGYYHNTAGAKNDHVHCFVVSDWQRDPKFKRKILDILEIKNVEWFELDNLPDNLSFATKNRIKEFLDNKKNLFGQW